VRRAPAEASSVHRQPRLPLGSILLSRCAMTLRDFTEGVLAFIRENEAWGPAIVLVLAFGESLAFISLLLPATVILFGVGALIGASGIDFWPIWTAAFVGAVFGDWLSFWIGLRFKAEVAHVWPLSRYPDLIPRGHAFFERWGLAGVFIGRFFGPLRAAVPLVAGICAMPSVPFQIANVASALVWATGILAPGAFGMRWLQDWL
jgi:membrane protein DedA with SNARE-associated domain